MKRSALGLLSLAMACIAGRLDAASDYNQYTIFDWFGASFEACAIGGDVTTDTGVKEVGGSLSGSWTVPSGATAKIAFEDGSKCIDLDLVSINDDGLKFDALKDPPNGYFDGYRIDCAAVFRVIRGLPELPSDTKTAMALVAEGATTNFYGYSKNGWVRLISVLKSIDPTSVYEQRAEFSNINGAHYVTFSIKVGGEYAALVDEQGNSRIRIDAYDPVDTLEFRGKTYLNSIGGITVSSQSSGSGVVAPGYPLTSIDWFKVMMQEATVGEVLAEKTGVIDDSGAWKVPASGYVATVREELDEKYLCVEPSNSNKTGPEFAATKSSDGEFSQIEFSMRFFNDDLALITPLPGDTKAAMTLADADGKPSFHGYTANGWVALSTAALQPEYAVWYNLLASFERREGVLYVSYYVKTFDGLMALGDASGNTRFAAAGNEGDTALKFVNLLGDADVKFMNGVEMAVDPKRSYYWIGGLYADANNGTNWSHSAGGAPCSAEDVPGVDASLIINSKSAIRIFGNLLVSNLVLNADLTIEGEDVVRSTYDPQTGHVNGLAGDQLGFAGVFGTGKLTLRNVVMLAVKDGANIDTRTEFDADTTSGLYCDGKGITINGDVSGSGNIIGYQADGERGVTFAGVNDGFYGIYTETVFDDQDLGLTRLASGNSSFPNAAMNLLRSFSANTTSEQAPFGMASDVYAFGSYNGHLITAKSTPTVVIGGRNEDCVIDGSVACGKKTQLGYWITTIVKIGSARLTAKVTNIGALDIRGGEVKLVGERPMYLDPKQYISFNGGALLCDAEFDPSPYIANSLSAIAFNDEGINHTWATALSSSNVGGLRKMGKGVLTLMEIPRYTGETLVEEGSLVVPYGTMLGAVKISSGAEIKIDLTGATSESGVLFYAESAEGLPEDSKELFINVPAGFKVPSARRLPDGGVIYAIDSSVYDWTNLSGDGRWMNNANWKVNGTTATTTPGHNDIVRMPAMGGEVIVDTSVEVAMVSCAEGAPTFRFVSPVITNGNYATDDTTVLKIRAGAIANFCGAGRLEITGDAALNVASGNSESFVGNVSAATLVKRGKGEAVIAGVNEFASLKIESGTLRIGNHDDIEGIRMDMDATDASRFSFNADGSVNGWGSKVGEMAFKYDAGTKAFISTEWFEGRSAVSMMPSGEGAYSRYKLEPSNAESKSATKSLFVVYHAGNMAGGACLYGESVNSGHAMKIRGDDAWHYWVEALGNSADGFYTGLSATSDLVVEGNDILTSWIGTTLAAQGDNTLCEYLGTSGTQAGFCGAIGEVVGYDRNLTHVERIAVQRSLMVKWGLGEETYEVLPVNATIEMASGTTLNLGGFEQVVASFSGAGVVTNGLLVTADGYVAQTGDSLVIPAVDGTVYGMSGRKPVLMLTGAKGKAVTIVVPGNCMSGKVFCEGEITWKLGSDAIIVSGPENGWYSLTNVGGGSTVIIR